MNHQAYLQLCELFDEEPIMHADRWGQMSDSEKRGWIYNLANHWFEMQRALRARERIAKASKAMNKAAEFDDERDC